MPSSPSILGRIIKILADFMAGAAAAGIIVTVLLQVASRLLRTPVPWTEEATRFLFVWMIFLGLAAGFRTVESARVVVFIAMMPAAFRRLTVPIYVASSGLFFTVMGWTGWTLVLQQRDMNETAATLATPMWVIGLVIPVSSVLALAAIVDSLMSSRDLIALPEISPLPADLHATDVSTCGEVRK